MRADRATACMGVTEKNPTTHNKKTSEKWVSGEEKKKYLFHGFLSTKMHRFIGTSARANVWGRPRNYKDSETQSIYKSGVVVYRPNLNVN